MPLVVILISRMSSTVGDEIVLTITAVVLGYSIN